MVSIWSVLDNVFDYTPDDEILNEDLWILNGTPNRFTESSTIVPWSCVLKTDMVISFVRDHHII